MNRTALAATAVVALNLGIATVHGKSHAHAGVPLEPWQRAFVLVVVYALPVLAAVLFWTPLQRTAAGVLGASMLAGTLFGIYFHFVADTVDHVSHRSPGGSGTLFVASAVLLVPVGVLGMAFAVWSWKQSRRVAA